MFRRKTGPSALHLPPSSANLKVHQKVQVPVWPPPRKLSMGFSGLGTTIHHEEERCGGLFGPIYIFGLGFRPGKMSLIPREKLMPIRLRFLFQPSLRHTNFKNIFGSIFPDTFFFRNSKQTQVILEGLWTGNSVPVGPRLPCGR